MTYAAEKLAVDRAEAAEQAPDYAGHSAAHTPGPWVINGTAICGREPQLPWRERDEYPDGTFMVAESVFNVANARLIAAAPDILMALNRAQKALALIVEPNAIKQSTVLHAFAQTMEAEAAARAAIAKAECRQ